MGLKVEDIKVGNSYLHRNGKETRKILMYNDLSEIVVYDCSRRGYRKCDAEAFLKSCQSIIEPGVHKHSAEVVPIRKVGKSKNDPDQLSVRAQIRRA